ncbi:dynamin family protein [Rhodococcoides kyotonense]|uniref:Dynamin family protein n=1 Tax=Rhodococcoides kyotonense TaxID=398843 RepID=A0A239LNQ2_9NOCA|nr:dynamin family protein [Rhodococcus kyotonensis]SNT31254.1 Dynamin family protein [Rhodococcus kyotonensis]
MTDLDRAHALLIEARAVLGSDRVVDARIVDIRARLDSPLRIALAGTVKAGKSTLLNALVGEEIAPSDATECTRVVTWFVRGRIPSIAVTTEGRTRALPVERTDGRLILDLGDVPADRVERLEVTWPSSLLERYTVVDTPGTASNSRDVSRRTMALLAPSSGHREVDAVVYLTRDLQPSDVDILDGLRGAGAAGPLGVIVVHSRVDEARGEQDSSILPVSGLLALRGRTLRQREFDAFLTLASVPDLERSLLSVDRFAKADLPVDSTERRTLARRFGLFGIRSAVSIVRSGVSSAPELAAELVRRSGVAELEHRIDVHFGARHTQSKIHDALTSVQKLLEARLDARSAPLLRRVDRALAEDHLFEELTVLASLQTDPLATTEWQRNALDGILGGRGLDPATRLGLPENTGTDDVVRTARAALRYWRFQLSNPLLSPRTTRAYRAAARSAEAILH